MNDDDLDNRIRRMVTTIVDGDAEMIAPLEPPAATGHRRWVLAGLGVAASAALVVTALAARGDRPSQLVVATTGPTADSATTTTLSPDCPTASYTIVEGDTLESIAATAGVAVNVLTWINSIDVVTAPLVAGTVINVPLPGCRYSGPPLVPPTVVVPWSPTDARRSIAPEAAWTRVEREYLPRFSVQLTAADQVADEFVALLRADIAENYPGDTVNIETRAVDSPNAVYVVNLSTFDDSFLEDHYFIEFAQIEDTFLVTAIWKAIWCRGDFFYEPGKPCI
jgi:LysM repeat protein